MTVDTSPLDPNLPSVIEEATEVTLDVNGFRIKITPAGESTFLIEAPDPLQGLTITPVGSKAIKVST